MDQADPVTRVALPAGGYGAWRTLDWVSPVAQTLEKATLEVDPPIAFRALTVRRANGDILANESWSPNRARGVRIWPADMTVAAGETLRVEAVSWWATPVDLTLRMTWRKDGSV